MKKSQAAIHELHFYSIIIYIVVRRSENIFSIFHSYFSCSRGRKKIEFFFVVQIAKNIMTSSYCWGKFTRTYLWPGKKANFYQLLNLSVGLVTKSI